MIWAHPVSDISALMGKGKQGAKAKSEVAKVEAPKPDAAQAVDMESRFMKALQEEMGDVEITEASVREYIAKMTPEQRQRLQSEGKDLKQELVTNTDHKEELQVFRKEVNAKAEAAGLPVEKDGEHLGRKLLTHMKTSTDSPPYLLVLEAIASCSFLVKLAVAEVQEGAPKAAEEDLTTIEEGLRRLKVNGWRNEEEEAGRAPFVRRNLLLLHFVLYCEKIELTLQEGTQRALSELSAKVRRRPGRPNPPAGRPASCTLRARAAAPRVGRR